MGGNTTVAGAKSSPAPRNGCTPRNELGEEDKKKKGNVLLNNRPFADELVYPDFRLLLEVVIYLQSRSAWNPIYSRIMIAPGAPRERNVVSPVQLS